MSNKIYGVDIYNMQGDGVKSRGYPEKTPCAVYSVDMGGARV